MLAQLVIFINIFILIMICHWLINSSNLWKKIVLGRNIDSGEADPEVAIPKNKKAAALLFLHGFGGSAKDFSGFTEAFLREYDIFIPTLPGHGGTPAEFSKSHFDIWLEFAKRYYRILTQNYPSVFVIGFSMGGVLAYALAGNKTLPQPAGLVSIATPITFNNPFLLRQMPSWQLFITGWLGMFQTLSPEATVIKKINHDGATWSGFKTRYFPRQVHTVKLALAALRPKLRNVSYPVCILHAQGDRSVPFENALVLKAKLKQSHKVIFQTLNLAEQTHEKHFLQLYSSTKYSLQRSIADFLAEISLKNR